MIGRRHNSNLILISSYLCKVGRAGIIFILDNEETFFNHIEIYNSVVLSTFTLLYNSHHPSIS